MIKTKFIFLLFLSIISFNFTVKSFEHTFGWLDEKNKDDNITAKVFSVDTGKIASYFKNDQQIVWAIQEFKKLKTYTYLLEIDNQSDRNIDFKINHSILKLNFFGELENNMFAPLVFPHPIISSSLFLFVFAAIGFYLNKQLNLDEEPLYKIISCNITIALLLGSTIFNIQSYINRNHNLLTTVKSTKSNSIQPWTKVYIPIFVANKKKETFECKIKNYKLKLEKNTLSIY